MDLRKTLFVVPNLFTLSSLCCGFFAISLCLGSPGDEDFYRAALAIVVGMFLDAVDGRVARLTRTQSAFGTQIDSLADVITFGVAPAVLVFRWTLWDWRGVWGLVSAMVYLCAGAIRLARFNVIAEREAARGHSGTPGKYILGMPIPTAAGVLVSLVVLNRSLGGLLREASALFGALCIFLGVLMIAPINFRSFKDLQLNLPTICFLVLVAGASMTLAFFLRPSFVFVWLLGGYVILGLTEALIGLSRRLGNHTPQIKARRTGATKARGGKPE